MCHCDEHSKSNIQIMKGKYACLLCNINVVFTLNVCMCYLKFSMTFWN